MIHSEEVCELLRDAVMTDSVNHRFKENRTGEADLCDWVEYFFQKLGVPFERQSVRDRQRNLIARIEGENPDQILCFESHLDTTTARGMQVHPFGAEENDGHIHGRGACDSKASLAAMMAALKAIQESGETPPQTVMLAATIDKEVGLSGIQHLLDSELRPTAAVVGAPTNLNVARCGHGCARWRISVGESPQSYAPADRNAALDAARLIVRIEETVGRMLREKPHPLLGPAIIRPSRIRANCQEGFLPPNCAIDYEYYAVPGCELEVALEEVNDLIGNLIAEEPDLKISVELPTLDDPPAELPESAPLVRAALKAADAVRDSARIVGFPDSGHLNRFAAAGIDAIALGPGDPKKLRTVDECVPIDQLAPAAEIYLAMMKTPLG